MRIVLPCEVMASTGGSRFRASRPQSGLAYCRPLILVQTPLVHMVIWGSRRGTSVMRVA